MSSYNNYKNLMEKAGYTLDEITAVLTQAISLGCQATLLFTKSGTDAGDITSDLDFYTQRLPTLEKRIVSVDGGAAGENWDGGSADQGDVITYALDVTFHPRDSEKSNGVSYRDVYVTDAQVGRGEDNPIRITVPENAAGLTEAVTVTEQVTYTVGQDDVERGSVVNEAQLHYNYKSNYGQGTLSISSSARAAVDVRSYVRYCYEAEAGGPALPEALAALAPADGALYGAGQQVILAVHPCVRYTDEENGGTWTLGDGGKWTSQDGVQGMPGETFSMTSSPLTLTAVWTFVAAPAVSVSKEGELTGHTLVGTDGVEYTADYTIEVRNTGGEALMDLTLTDADFPPDAADITCLVGETPVPAEWVTYDRDGHTLTVRLPGGLPAGETLTVAYAAAGQGTLDQNGIFTLDSPVWVRASGGVSAASVQDHGGLETPLKIYGRITIIPADIVIYARGDSVEDSDVVEGADGAVAAHTNLPEPGFYITLPEAAAQKLRQALGREDLDQTDLSPYLTFVDSAGNVWGLEPYAREGESMAMGRYLYRLLPVTEGQDPLRMQFYDGEKYIVESDFDITQALHREYDMSIYPGYVEAGTVEAVLTVGDRELGRYDLGLSPGKLIVRGTTTDRTTTDILGADESPSQAVEQITARTAADTLFYINASSLEVEDPAAVKLLVDSIVDSRRGDILEGMAAQAISGLYDTPSLEHQFRYLDLVDTSMGNTWVTASQFMELIWPYPAGVDRETEFTVVHYRGMDRDYDLETMDQLVLGRDYTLEIYTTVRPLPENTQSVTYFEMEAGEQGLRFTAQGFSPYALVWPQATGSSGGGTPESTEDHVAYLVGRGGGGIQPLACMTRGEAATVFFRLMAAEDLDRLWCDETLYADVAAGSWYHNAVATVSRMGTMTGYPDGTFAPDAPITRAEFAAAAVRFFQLPAGEESTLFSDVGPEDWFAGAVWASAAAGLVTGRGDGTFAPDEPITRAEAAAILNRALGREVSRSVRLEQGKEWTDNDPRAWYYGDMLEASVSHRLRWIRDGDGAAEAWLTLLEEPDWALLERYGPDGQP